MIDRRTLTAIFGVLACIGAAGAMARPGRRRRLDGQVVFITGGSRGLGLALALECARRGATIAICGRNQDLLESASRQVAVCGGRVLAISCDVRNQGEVQDAIARAEAAFGRIDMLINNAGVIAVGPAAAMTRDDYEEAMDTHFWAMYYAVEAALPILRRQRGGRIVNVTSIGGKVSVPHLLPYCASKFAAVGYSEGLRAELRGDHIFVTTVCPGLMRTGSPRNAWFKAQHRKEYAWFKLSGTLPGGSIAASSAARQIVNAALRGEPEIVVSLPAKLLAFAEGIAPRLVARGCQVAARLLPGSGGIDRERARGYQSASAISESVLTLLGKKAEHDYNQIS